MSTGRTLKILMLDSEASWRGGEAQCLLLMRGLREMGHDVELAAPGGGALTARAVSEGFVVHALRFSGGADFATAVGLRKLLVRGGYDVVHAHASHAHSAMALACVGLRGRPLRVASRRVDFRVGAGPVGALKYRHGTDVTLAISKRVRDILESAGVRAGRIRLVRSGIDLSRLEHAGDGLALRSEFGLHPEQPVIGTIAALAPHKALCDLLDAMRIVRDEAGDVRLFIIGDGELADSLRHRARELGILDCVTFTGYRDDAVRFLPLFSVFVISSRLEGLCTSIMDAQAAGVPVVATRTGGIPDIVEEGVTGLLAPPADPNSLAAAIVRMLSDRTLSDACIANAKEASIGYDYREMVYKTEAAYREFLG